MSVNFSKFRWPLVGVLSVLALGLILQDPAHSVRPVLVGTAVGLLLSGIGVAFRRARAHAQFLAAENLWQQGAPASTVAERLVPYRGLGGELGYRIGNLLGYAHLDLGWKQTAWSDFLEAQIARAPWWRRRQIASFLGNLPAQPEAADLRTGLRLAQACPGVPRLLHAAGILHLRLGQPEQAWTCFRAALPSGAEDPLMLEDLFLASLEREDLHEVAEAALALLSERHGDARLGWDRGAAGRFLVGQRRFVEAVALLQKLPPDKRTTLWHWAALGIGLHALGELEPARAVVEEGLRQHPRGFRLWMERFNLTLASRDDEAAETSLFEAGRCLSDEPGVEALRWELSLRHAEFSYWVRGDAEAAMAFLEAVPPHLQNADQPLLGLHLLIATGDFQAAHSALHPLLARHPDDLEMQLLQAEILAGMEHWKALLPYLEQLPVDARNRALFWNLRGLALVNLGDAFHSRLDLERAAHMEPTTLRFVLDAGHGCLELGEWERSEAHWRQALRIEPTLEEALVQLAEARRAGHDLPGARQLLRECLTHHPSSEDAQARLAELEAN